MTLRFDDHASFHRAALGMTAGALALGLGLHPLTSLAPYLAGVGGIAIGAAIGYGRAPWRLVAGGLATIPLFAMAPGWGTLALVASLLSLGLAFGLRGLRGLVTLGLGIGATLLAVWCAVRIGHAKETASWSGLARDGVAAMAMGLVGILAMLPRHLRLEIDPVANAQRRLPATLDDEVRRLCDRAVSIWSEVAVRLPDADAGKDLLRDGVMKTLDVAAKSAVAPAGPSDQELALRIVDLDERIAKATDPEVKSQYQAARGAVEDQRRYHAAMRTSRERLVARLHGHVAALEKFQLAAANLEATRATAGQLADVSHELTATGDALAELEAAPAARAS